MALALALAIALAGVKCGHGQYGNRALEKLGRLDAQASIAGSRCGAVWRVRARVRGCGAVQSV